MNPFPKDIWVDVYTIKGRIVPWLIPFHFSRGPKGNSKKKNKKREKEKGKGNKQKPQGGFIHK